MAVVVDLVDAVAVAAVQVADHVQNVRGFLEEGVSAGVQGDVHAHHIGVGGAEQPLIPHFVQHGGQAAGGHAGISADVVKVDDAGVVGGAGDLPQQLEDIFPCAVVVGQGVCQRGVLVGTLAVFRELVPLSADVKRQSLHGEDAADADSLPLGCRCVVGSVVIKSSHFDTPLLISRNS